MLTNIKWLIENATNVDSLRISLAKGEIMELERVRDILVITPLVGHWVVPYTDGILKQLREAAVSKWSPDQFRRLIKSLRGQQLIDESYHSCSFYSHVVVQQ